MDRRAVGATADRALEGLSVLPSQKGISPLSIAGETAAPGHLQVTMMREPDLVMSVRRMLIALVASALWCGVAIPAQAQSAASKAAAKSSADKSSK